MELKFENSYTLSSEHDCSNRTFMELKSHTTLQELVCLECSNRTFMELKL